MITDTDAKRKISSTVRRLMKDRGVSQAELARATEESEMRISLLVRGEHLPSAAFLKRVAEALSATTDEFME